MNHHGYRRLFQEKIGHPVFGATLPRDRFWFLMSNICFDNKNTRTQRFQSDHFAAFREIYEMFNRKCSSTLQADEYLALDETLYGCRNQISFKQYNSSKPEKYGLLFKSINAVRYPFTFQSCVYSGKPVGDAGPYYTPGVTQTVQSLVTKLGNEMDLSGRNITMDHFYTSFELLE